MRDWGWGTNHWENCYKWEGERAEQEETAIKSKGKELCQGNRLKMERETIGQGTANDDQWEGTITGKRNCHQLRKDRILKEKIMGNGKLVNYACREKPVINGK